LYEKRQDSRRNAKRMIWVTFQREGIHCYPDAAKTYNAQNPNDPDDVIFLAYTHRHIFHFRVGIHVTHNDRDIEFIQFKRWLESLFMGKLALNNKSCEMISDDIYDIIASRYPERDIEITVSEDNENGATIFYAVN